MFDWTPDYSVGIGSIDGQHQKLFSIARELYSAMSAGQGKEALGRILDRLAQYTEVHFAHEERLMREHDFPGLADHKAEHDALKGQVRRFQQDFEAGRVVLTVELLHFLRDWLQKHIMGSDQRYAPFLKQRLVV
jgi:hemerythrin-like metal-binding protein